jgi:hypothetical protein
LRRNRPEAYSPALIGQPRLVATWTAEHQLQVAPAFVVGVERHRSFQMPLVVVTYQ